MKGDKVVCAIVATGVVVLFVNLYATHHYTLQSTNSPQVKLIFDGIAQLGSNCASTTSGERCRETINHLLDISKAREGPAKEEIDDDIDEPANDKVFVQHSGRTFSNYLPEKPCKHLPFSTFPMCTAHTNTSEQVSDLMSRLSNISPQQRAIEAKFGLLSTTSLPVQELGLPPLQWWCEALHGVRCTRGVNCSGEHEITTQFPQVIGLAASFNRTLWSQIASISSRELLAFAQVGAGCSSAFSPNVNIFRDPRWGRGQETPGEDPLVVSEYAIQFISGFQRPYASQPSTSNDRIHAAATCKHFAAYDLEQLYGVNRHTHDARVSEFDMADSYLPPFEACVRANVAMVMCSYNRVNGIPACANEKLLTKTLKNEWGFMGVVVSDCKAIHNLVATHAFVSNAKAAVAAALSAGVDMECGNTFTKNGLSSFKSGLVSQSLIDTALSRVLNLRIRLGMFDTSAPQESPLSLSAVNSLAHQHLALHAAHQSVVLLKNENNILPISPNRDLTLAVVGPHAHATNALLGNYFGTPPYLVSPFDGFCKLAGHCEEGDKKIKLSLDVKDMLLGRVLTIRDCLTPLDPSCSSDSYISRVESLIGKADVIVIAVGLNQDFESERKDRYDLELPNSQNVLISRVTNKIQARGLTETSVIVVVMSGSPVDLWRLRNNPGVSAVLWAGYPGQSGGQAIADVILGTVSPAARLPFTLYPASYIDQISYFDMQFRPHAHSPGRTYKYYRGPPPSYWFGDGLSFASFSYELAISLVANTNVDKQHVGGAIDVCGLDFDSIPVHLRVSRIESSSIDLVVKVRNTGSRSSDHVVLVFATPPLDPSIEQATRHLIAFERVHVKGSQTSNVTFRVQRKDLSEINENGKMVIRPGRHVLTVGTSSSDQPQTAVVCVG